MYYGGFCLGVLSRGFGTGGSGPGGFCLGVLAQRVLVQGGFVRGSMSGRFCPGLYVPEYECIEIF